MSKITKGSGFSVFPCKSIREHELSSNVGVQNSTGHIVASCGPASNEHSVPNADLIAEAFNVANETGLTPRQLLEQRNELLEALIEQALLTDTSTPEGVINHDKLHALISKANVK